MPRGSRNTDTYGLNDYISQVLSGHFINNNINRYGGLLQSSSNDMQNQLLKNLPPEKQQRLLATGLLTPQENPEAINELASEFMGAGVYDNLGGGLLATIAGRNAKNADLALLAKAEEMKATGKNADEIYTETKWWLDHPDGQPRFEIDDSKSSLLETNWAEQRQALRKENPKLGKSLDRYEYGIKGELSPKQKNNYQKMLDENGLLHPNEAFRYRSNVSHKEIIDNYPQFKDISYRKADYLQGADGDFSGNFNTNTAQIRVKKNPIDRMHSTTLHEGQHAIQSLEGFAKGGSTEEFIYELQKTYDDLFSGVKNINSRMKNISDKMDSIANDFGFSGTEKAAKIKKLRNDYNALLDERQSFVDQIRLIEGEYGIQETAFNKYKKLAGESEARLVQDRMNMSMDERLTNPFYKNYDVPFEDMIIRGLLE